MDPAGFGDTELPSLSDLWKRGVWGMQLETEKPSELPPQEHLTSRAPSYPSESQSLPCHLEWELVGTQQGRGGLELDLCLLVVLKENTT